MAIKMLPPQRYDNLAIPRLLIGGTWLKLKISNK